MTALLFTAMIAGLLVLRVNLSLILFAAAAFVHIVWVDGSVEYLIQDMWDALDAEIILAIPLFLLVAAIMSRGAVAQRLIDIMVALTRPLPAGMAVAAILSCAVFSAVSGSSIVTLLAVGTIMYPALVANGYSRYFAVGALCAGGTLGIIIPPSIPMILYGVVTETSIAALFVAGVGPGLLLSLVFSVYAVVVNRHLKPQPLDLSEVVVALRRGGPALFLPILLLGGIYSGYFSATEAAAVALLYAVVIETLLYRELSLPDYFEIVADSGKLLGALLPLIAVAVSMNYVLVEQRVPQYLIELMLERVSDAGLFLLMTNLALLALGCIMDTASAIMIASPFLKPLAEAYGIDPIHFGVLMILNLEIGILTPPFGLNLIVGMTAFREKFGFICRAVIPWIGLMLLCLILVAFLPGIAMGLVR